MTKKLILVDVSRGMGIAGHFYQVKIGKGITGRLKEGNYYGRCYNTEKQILTDNSVPSPLCSNNLIHETIHAIDDCYDTKLSETQVKRIANGFHQVMEEFGIRFVTGKPKGK